MERLDSRYLPANLVEGEVEVSSEPKRVIGYAVHTFAEEPLSTERRTLVFLPGMGFAGRFSGPYKYNKLLEFGVRLIVVERPGYGMHSGTMRSPVMPLLTVFVSYRTRQEHTRPK
jgi:hypothetical protein